MAPLLPTHNPETTSFRDNLSQFRWSSNIPQAQPAAPPPPSSNSWAFSRFYSSTSEPEPESMFSMSRMDRLLAFGVILLGSLACFAIAFFSLPLLLLKPSKFALSFALGSILFLSAFSVLLGPMTHLRHLLSKERIVFTSVWAVTLVGGVMSALVWKSWVGSLVFGVGQVISLAGYGVAYFPGGQAGMRLGAGMLGRGIGL